jgi:hypothetical protein
MRKIILLLIATAIVSCGGEKKKPEVQAEVAQDKYYLLLDCVYEKDDSIVAFYKLNEYFKYDKPVSLKIKGSPLNQRLTIDIPAGIAIEDLTLIASTNKEQKYIAIKNISVLNNEKVAVDGDNFKHSQYFLSDASFSWDVKNQRYNLNHSNEFPPAFVGSDQLKSLLLK